MLFLFYSVSSTAAEKIEYCYDIDSPPFVLGSGPVVHKGLVVELYKAIFDKLPDYNPVIKAIPWQSCVSTVKRGSIDGVTTLFYTAERAKALEYTDSLLTVAVRFYFQQTKYPAGISWNKLIDLKPYKMGLMKGQSHGEEMDQLLKNNEFKVELIASNGLLNFKKLASGRVDLVPEIEYFATYYIKTLNYQDKIIGSQQIISSNRMHMAFSKKSPFKKLIPQINKIIEVLKNDGTIERISQKYLSTDTIPIMNSASD